MPPDAESNHAASHRDGADNGRPWLSVSVAGLLALALIAAAIPAWFFSGDRIQAVTERLRIPAANLRVVEGHGEPVEDAVRITAASERGVAVLAARFSQTPDIAGFHRLAIELAQPSGAAPDLMFMWGPPDARRPTQNHQLSGLTPHIKLDQLADWPDRIGSIALVLMGPGTQGTEVRGLTFEGPPPTVFGLYEKIVSGWLTQEVWTQYNVNLIKGGGGPLIVSPVLVAGAWMVLTVFLFASYRLARRQGVAAGPVFAVLATAWLLLDARWQYDLTRTHADTYSQFAGVPAEAKTIPDVGEEFLSLIRTARSSLAADARVLVVSESELFRKYARYRLLPLSSYYRDDFPPDVFRHLQSGDAVLILGASEATAGGLRAQVTPALRRQLPYRFGVQALEPADAQFVDDPSAPDGQALEATGDDATLFEGPGHGAPPEGYYRADFLLRPPEGLTDTRVRVQVLRYPPGEDEPTVLAEREGRLDAGGYARLPLMFPWSGQGKLSYRVARAPAGTRSAGVRLSLPENAEALALISRDREPPYLVARPIARSDIGLLLRIP